MKTPCGTSRQVLWFAGLVVCAVVERSLKFLRGQKVNFAETAQTVVNMCVAESRVAESVSALHDVNMVEDGGLEGDLRLLTEAGALITLHVVLRIHCIIVVVILRHPTQHQDSRGPIERHRLTGL